MGWDVTGIGCDRDRIGMDGMGDTATPGQGMLAPLAALLAVTTRQ